MGAIENYTPTVLEEGTAYGPVVEALATALKRYEHYLPLLRQDYGDDAYRLMASTTLHYLQDIHGFHAEIQPAALSGNPETESER